MFFQVQVSYVQALRLLGSQISAFFSDTEKGHTYPRACRLQQRRIPAHVINQIGQPDVEVSAGLAYAAKRNPTHATRHVSKNVFDPAAYYL